MTLGAVARKGCVVSLQPVKTKTTGQHQAKQGRRVVLQKQLKRGVNKSATTPKLLKEKDMNKLGSFGPLLLIAVLTERKQ